MDAFLWCDEKSIMDHLESYSTKISHYKTNNNSKPINTIGAFISPLTKAVNRHLRTIYKWTHLCLTTAHFTYEEAEAQTSITCITCSRLGITSVKCSTHFMTPALAINHHTCCASETPVPFSLLFPASSMCFQKSIPTPRMTSIWKCTDPRVE